MGLFFLGIVSVAIAGMVWWSHKVYKSKRRANESLYRYMVIGVSGKKRSGKDTVSEYMSRTFGFHQMAFANPIKEALKHLFCLSDTQVHGDQKETPDPFWNVTPRELMQKFGTDIMRNHASSLIPEIGPHFWTTRLKYEYETRFEPFGTPVVISDVRFPNECQLIKNMGGFIIYVHRPSLHSTDTHSSETSVSQQDADFIIENNQDLSHLYREVDQLMVRIGQSSPHQSYKRHHLGSK